MEQHTYYDLFSDETVLWWRRYLPSEVRKSYLKKDIIFRLIGLIPAFLAIVYLLTNRTSLIILGKSLPGAGTFIIVLFILIAILVLAVPIFSYFVNGILNGELTYCLTDSRIFIVRGNRNKRIIRSQYITDIELIEVMRRENYRSNLYFSPPNNISVLEHIQKKERNQKRKIAMNAPMAFLNVYDAGELLYEIEKLLDVDIHYMN